MFTNQTTNPAPATDQTPRHRTLRRFGQAKVAAAAIAVAGLTLAGVPLLSASPAQAITFSRQACVRENLTITPPAGGGSRYVPLGPALAVTLSKPAYVVAFLSIDGNVSSSTAAEMRASWSVNGATPTDFEYGPGNIHESDGPFEALTHRASNHETIQGGARVRLSSGLRGPARGSQPRWTRPAVSSGTLSPLPG